MSKIRKAITGLSKLTAILIIELAMRVGKGLNSNPTIFVNPIPPGDDIIDAATTANESFNQAQGGNRAQKNKFKTDLETLKSLLRASCAYVNSIANGDTNKLIASGFELSRIAEPKPAPTAVSKMEAIYVNRPGQALAKWKGSKYHTYYILQVSTDPTNPDSWKDVTSLTGRQYLVTNLASGKMHYFRVISVGSRSSSLPGETASVMVA